jgi:hypothetical protein
MKNLPAKKWSFLGLILIAASAVTARILPSSNKNDNQDIIMGTLTYSDDGMALSLTCSATENLIGYFCDISITGTTGPGDFSEDAAGVDTTN